MPAAPRKDARDDAARGNAARGGAADDPYAPPAALLGETLTEERDWKSFTVTRRMAIAGCALGVLGCAAGLVYALDQIEELSLDASVLPRVVAIPSALAAVYLASIAALWPARGARWLRVLVALLQVPVAGLAGVFGVETVMTLSSLPTWIGPSFWYENGLMSAALLVPALTFWMACGAAGQAWWQARRAAVPG